MADRIKGLTIQIGGETSGLKEALKDVDSSSKKLNSELRDVNKLLKLDPSNTELVAQKQKILAEQIKTTETRLDALKQSQNTIDFSKIENGDEKYRAFQREIVETETKLRSYKIQLSNVAPSQDALATGTQRLSTYFKATNTTVEDYSSTLGTRLTNAIKTGTATSGQLDVALGKIGKEAGISAQDIGQLKEKLDKADQSNLDAVNQDIKQLGTSAETSSEKVEGIAKSLGSDVLMNAGQSLQDISGKVTEFGGKAMTAFSSYDDGCDTIIKKTGASGTQLEGFTGIYNNLVNNIAVTDPYEKAGSAVGELSTQFGYTGDTLESMSGEMMKFAELNDTDVTTSVQGAEQAMSAFGISSEQLPAVLDAVTYSSQQTGASADSIFQACTNGSGVLQDLGLDFNQSALLMGVFTQSGVDANAAVTQLSKANANWSKEGLTMQDGLSQLQQTLQGNGSDTEKLAAITDTFGSKGAEKIKKLAESGSLDFSNLGASCSAMGGTLDSTFNTITGSDEKFEQSQQQMQTALAKLGGVIFDALLPVVQSLGTWLGKLSDWFTNLPAPIQNVIVWLGSAVGIIGSVAGTISILIGIFGPLKAAITGCTMAAKIGGAVLSLVTSPIGLIVIAIAAVVGVIIYLWNTNEGFRNAVIAIWEAVKGAVITAWNGIKGAFDAIGNGIEAVKGFFGGLKDSAVTKFNELQTGVQGAMDRTHTGVSGASEMIKGVLTGNTEQATSGAMQLYNSLPGPVQDVLKGMAGHVSDISQGISSSFQEHIEGMKNGVYDKVNWLKGKLEWIVEKIRGIFDIDLPQFRIKLPHFSTEGHFSLNPPSIPTFNVDWYANGGILTKPTIFGANGSSLMGGGEAGKEAVAPIDVLQGYIRDAVGDNRNTEIISLLETIVKNMATMGMTVNFESQTDSPYENARKIKQLQENLLTV